MATATNQDILEAYQQSIGAGEGQVNTQLLIQALRERQRMAELQDMDRAGRIKSVGKTGLNLLKARRDFLLAKRGNPNLSFKDLILARISINKPYCFPNPSKSILNNLFNCSKAGIN